MGSVSFQTSCEQENQAHIRLLCGKAQLWRKFCHPGAEIMPLVQCWGCPVPSGAFQCGVTKCPCILS